MHVLQALTAVFFCAYSRAELAAASRGSAGLELVSCVAGIMYYRNITVLTEHYI